MGPYKGIDLFATSGLSILVGMIIMMIIITFTSSIRVRILENNTVTHVDIPSSEEKLYKPNDTIWINLSTHKIDDIDTSAMKAVILTK